MKKRCVVWLMKICLRYCEYHHYYNNFSTTVSPLFVVCIAEDCTCTCQCVTRMWVPGSSLDNHSSMSAALSFGAPTVRQWRRRNCSHKIKCGPLEVQWSCLIFGPRHSQWSDLLVHGMVPKPIWVHVEWPWQLAPTKSSNPPE